VHHRSAWADSGYEPFMNKSAATTGMESTGEKPGTSRARTDPERWVDDYGDALFRYALMRLRDATRAEDVVQEAFLAALRSRERFAGQSSELTWLIGILKNKILDYFRKAGRETSFTDLNFLEDEGREAYEPDGPFKDCWIHERGPVEWTNAGASLDNDLFWDVFRECAGKLPDKIAQVFVLRELDDVSSEEICQRLAISPGNLWVMLHRARLALRRCLEINWFARGGGEASIP